MVVVSALNAAGAMYWCVLHPRDQYQFIFTAHLFSVFIFQECMIERVHSRLDWNPKNSAKGLGEVIKVKLPKCEFKSYYSCTVLFDNF